jgi:UDP-2,3-diacylglucosamine pyrophosphatase LpxH
MEDESATPENFEKKKILLGKDLDEYIAFIKKEDDEDIDVETFTNSFNNFLMNEEPDVLVISDTHVGAIGSHASLLDRTLNSIDRYLENGNKLQALLILGDYYDNICQDASGVKTVPEIINIFNKLDKLCNRTKVKITLGNHEIPIKYGLGLFYNFGKTRDAFVKMLSKHANGQFSTFLNPGNFCQYISMATDGSGNVTISTYDDLGGLKATTNGKILMTHGYQFFPKENDVCGIIWKELMRGSKEAKEMIDILYNANVKDHSDETVQGIHDAIGKPGKYEKLKLEDIKQARKQQELWYKKREEDNRDVDFRKREIETFLKKNKLTSFPKVIYGHTHKAVSFTIPVPGNSNVDVYNTGTWQHVAPTVIGIKVKDGQFAISAKTWDKTENAFKETPTS